MKRSELRQIIQEEIKKALMDKNVEKILKDNKKNAEAILDDAEDTIENVITPDDKKTKYEEGEGWVGKKAKK